MDDASPDVMVASTLYLLSGWAFDPTPCACRMTAIVLHLRALARDERIDPVVRSTAGHLLESWQRVQDKVAEKLEALAEQSPAALLH